MLRYKKLQIPWWQSWILQLTATRVFRQLVASGFWKTLTQPYHHAKSQNSITKCTIHPISPLTIYVKQRTASCWPLRAGGTCTLLRTSFVDMNTGRHWVLIVDQSDHGSIPDAVTWACAVRMKARFVLQELSRCSISCRNLVWWAPWDLPILMTGLGGVCRTISVKNLGEVIQNYHV